MHGFLLVGGEKMSKTSLNQIFPADLVGRLRRRRVPLPLPPRQPVRARRRLLLRGDGQPVQHRPGQQPRQPAVPGGHGGRQEVRRRRSGAVARLAPAPRSPPRPTPTTAAGWDAIAPSLALEATWKLIGAANAHLETNEPWKMEPGPELDAVMGDALEVLRLVAVLASPGGAGHVRRGLASASASPGRRPTSASRRRRPGAATRAGCRSRRARRCSRASPCPKAD